MELISFTVRNYRSITKAREIKVSGFTVLIGPNNEGKSNILRALALGMDVLSRWNDARFGRRILSRPRGGTLQYSWSDDFPVELQEKSPKGASVITLRFKLAPEEVKEFKKQTGSNINDELPVDIAFSQDKIALNIKKQGPGKKALEKSADLIARFLSERIQFIYIPAIRTADKAQEIVSGLVDRVLHDLEQKAEYRDAVQRLEKIQKPYLEKLSSDIARQVKEFLPAVSDVRVQVPALERYRALRRAVEIVVDDGVATPLQNKGDGVQSLVALAIMRRAAERNEANSDFVVEIEEPEAHLHPRAIHELKAVLSDLSQKSQVVISTHCPLLVNRVNIGSNILVQENTARAAEKISDIRDALGVRVSDNLTNAEVILLVEGDKDVRVLSKFLSFFSEKCRAALVEGKLALDPVGGGGNFSYKASLHLSQISSIHFFVDDDKSGKVGFQKVADDFGLGLADVNFAIVDGLEEAELEDLYDTTFIKKVFDDSFGVMVELADWNMKLSWKVNAQMMFRRSGKPWTDDTREKVKIALSVGAVNDIQGAISKRKIGTLSALKDSLEKKLGV